MARALIIDDDKPFREALAESIRDFGHAILEASAQRRRRRHASWRCSIGCPTGVFTSL
jgi:CheY-like chemotaxis protein